MAKKTNTTESRFYGVQKNIFYSLLIFILIPGSSNVEAVDINNCATLNVSGATYYLNHDIIDSPGIPIGSAFVCMDIRADNITLDCQEHRINGDGIGTNTYGGFLYGTKNVEVRNCIIDDWYVGVNIDGGYNNSLIGNNITSNSLGILMCCATFNNSVHNNNILLNSIRGVDIPSDVNDNALYANIVCYNPTDIRKKAPSTSYGYNNTCDNPDGWNDFGTIRCTNLCSTTHEFVCYCSNCSECEIKLNDSSCSVVYLASDIINHRETCIDNPTNFNNKIFDCQEHRIDGVDHVLNQQKGIYLNGKYGNDIRNCIIADFFRGIHLQDSTGNTIIDNIVSSNTDVGILLSNSTGNTITDNIACPNRFLDIGIVNTAGTNSGGNNMCNRTYNWNDTGAIGCTRSCTAICNCSTCDECEEKLNDSSCDIVYLIDDITNHTGTCIDNPENFNNKIFDCRRHTIDGREYRLQPLEKGIYLNGKSGNNIRNCIITDFVEGIHIVHSKGNVITNSILNSNMDVGILLSNSTNTTITDNIVCLNWFLDIGVVNTTGVNSGGNNLCNRTYNWNDTGAIGCTRYCSGSIPYYRLFILNLNYKQYLKEGNVDAKLRNAFMGEKISLSSNAEISKVDERNWRVIDGARYYRIEEGNGQLNIYEHGVVVENLNVIGLPSKVATGKEIVIFIKDEEGNPVPNASVRVVHSDGSVDTKLTDDGGMLKLIFEKFEKVKIIAEKSGYEKFEKEVEVSKEKFPEAEIFKFQVIIAALIAILIILLLLKRMYK